jgi:hypothetical protein
LVGSCREDSSMEGLDASLRRGPLSFPMRV